jgi:hypothetical protein
MARARKSRKMTNRNKKYKTKFNKIRRLSYSYCDEQNGFEPSPPPSPPSHAFSKRQVTNPVGTRVGASDDDENNDIPHLPRKKKLSIREMPGRCRGFRIARVLAWRNKAWEEEVDRLPNIARFPKRCKNTNYEVDFDVSVGDFVLVLSENQTNRVRCRNYDGVQGTIPRRMLQSIYMPWTIPANIRLDDDGVPFPLRFLHRSYNKVEGDGTAFVENEAVMISRPSLNLEFSEVVDVERSPGTIKNENLHEKYDVPWNIRVDAQEYEKLFLLNKAKHPKHGANVIGEKAHAKYMEINKGHTAFHEERREIEPNSRRTSRRLLLNKAARKF